MATDRKITTIAPWFGGARNLASEVGRLLNGCRWVGIPLEQAGKRNNPVVIWAEYEAARRNSRREPK